MSEQSLPASTVSARLVTLQEAADLLAVSSKTIHRAIASGALQACHIGTLVRIEPGELEAYIRRCSRTESETLESTDANDL